MARLSKRNARKVSCPTKSRPFKILLDRCKPSKAKKENASSGVGSSYGLRGRPRIESDFSTSELTGKLSEKLRTNKQTSDIKKKKKVNASKSAGGNLNESENNRIGSLKRGGSLDIKAIAKKKVNFYRAYRTLNSQDQPTTAKESENAGYRLRGRFMNLRNAHKASLKTVKLVKSPTLSVLVDKSNDVQQPAERSTRSNAASSVKRGGTQSAKRSSTRSSAFSKGSNREDFAALALGHELKPFVIKLVRLINCLICGEALDGATHTCNS